MKYNFNLKLQAVYGITGFIMTLGLLYLFTHKLDWFTSSIIGVTNFAISGFYSAGKCK
jgi:hypothetical protein